MRWRLQDFPPRSPQASLPQAEHRRAGAATCWLTLCLYSGDPEGADGGLGVSTTLRSRATVHPPAGPHPRSTPEGARAAGQVCALLKAGRPLRCQGTARTELRRHAQEMLLFPLIGPLPPAPGTCPTLSVCSSSPSKMTHSVSDGESAGGGKLCPHACRHLVLACHTAWPSRQASRGSASSGLRLLSGGLSRGRRPLTQHREHLGAESWNRAERRGVG